VAPEVILHARLPLADQIQRVNILHRPEVIIITVTTDHLIIPEVEITPALTTMLVPAGATLVLQPLVEAILLLQPLAEVLLVLAEVEGISNN
jgi:hypothetical protein